ncbi:riboflavin kinase, partial [Streptomyces sp. NPDC058964]|uniref:riboflavin kinase n=1 Tax=Streptomyces sp. NPDC058964 TaxID=3346681 RepID=UPI0036CF57DF
AAGVSAGYRHSGGGGWPAAYAVVTTPLFEGTARTLEAYAIDRVGLDLYGLHVAVDFLSYVRGQAKFDSLEALLEQMAEDVKRCRELIAADA